MNKLIDKSYSDEKFEYIDYSFDEHFGKLQANIYSGIVSDGEYAYFCYWISHSVYDSDLIVHAISLDDYSTLWTYKLDDKFFDCVNSIQLYDGKLFLAADYGCAYCIDTIDGSLVWQTKITKQDKIKNLLVEGCFTDKYFVLPCDTDGNLYYFDLKTGEVKGRCDVGFFLGFRLLYSEDDYVYVTSGSYLVRLKLLDD